MSVTEIERTELANRLIAAIGKEPTEPLMKCILPDGREQLAAKDDLRVLYGGLGGEISGLRAYVDSALAKQTRLYVATLSGFMLTIWGTLLAQIIA